MAISESYFVNLNTLRRAAQNGDLAAVASSIAATGTSVVMLAAMAREGGEVVCIPFAYLAPRDGVEYIADGRMTTASKAAYDKVHTILAGDTHVAHFTEFGGLVHVGLRRAGVLFKDNGVYDIVFPDGNPYEFFTPPVEV